MTIVKKTAVATALGAALALVPGSAQARHWRPWFPPVPPLFVPHHHTPGALIGLGIAGAVLGTAALVDAVIPHPVYVAPPPPPPPYYPYYDDAYRRGYDAGRRDAYYYDRYRQDRYAY